MLSVLTTFIGTGDKMIRNRTCPVVSRYLATLANYGNNLYTVHSIYKKMYIQQKIQSLIDSLLIYLYFFIFKIHLVFCEYFWRIDFYLEIACSSQLFLLLSE